MSWGLLLGRHSGFSRTEGKSYGFSVAWFSWRTPNALGLKLLLLGNKINKMPDLYTPHNPVQSETAL
jgi:hypothetical protein